MPATHAPTPRDDTDTAGPQGVADREDMPLPHDPKSVYLGGLFLLAVLAALYVAREVVLPVVLALMLKLLLQPLVRLMERVRIPRALGALLSLLLLLGVLVGLGTVLSSPAATWAQELPNAWPKLKEQMSWLQGPLSSVQDGLKGLGIDGALPSGGDLAGKLNPASWLGGIASGAGGIAGGLLETLFICFYFLVFGETFLRRLVEILPRFRDKREAVELSDQVEADLSAYLIAITVINAVVGAVMAAVMWACGIPGPPLWGVAAFALNYVPILGPLTGVVLFGVVGLLVKGFGWFGIVPAAAYLAVHVAEGEFITPMLLARRFTINPVAVMLGLVFWYWMWGVLGAILSVPILAITKIVCDRLRPFRAVGHLLEG